MTQQSKTRKLGTPEMLAEMDRTGDTVAAHTRHRGAAWILNWAAVGSDAGGDRAAAIYSLVGSRIELELAPFEYLEEILQRLPAGANPRKFTPRAWLATRG